MEALYYQCSKKSVNNTFQKEKKIMFATPFSAEMKPEIQY